MLPMPEGGAGGGMEYDAREEGLKALLQKLLKMIAGGYGDMEMEAEDMMPEDEAPDAPMENVPMPSDTDELDEAPEGPMSEDDEEDFGAQVGDFMRGSKYGKGGGEGTMMVMTKISSSPKGKRGRKSKRY